MTGYAKLFGSLLDSTVWAEELPTKIVWIAMLAMTDQDGVVESSVPGLARRAGVTREQCETALGIFLAPDPDSRTKDHDGRRIEVVDGGWRLINYEKYKDKASGEEKRAKAAARQRRLRDRRYGASRVTPRHASSHEITQVTLSEADSDSDSDSDTNSEAEAASEAAAGSPEISQIAEAIRSHPVFAALDADAIAEGYEIELFQRKQKPDWVVYAIADCALKSAGLGLTRETLQHKLVGFMKHARGPRDQNGHANLGAAPPSGPPAEIDLSKYGLEPGQKSAPPPARKTGRG